MKKRYMINMICIYRFKLFVLITLFTALFASPLKAQTPPIDLTELSIIDLLNVQIYEQSDDNFKESWANRWSIEHHYARIEFGEYQHGTRSLSTREVLTAYAVMPKSIVQEMHMTSLTYRATKKLNFSFQVPYIRQKTTHISRASGFGRFTIYTSGIGDVSLKSSYRLKLKDNHNIVPSLGISFPIGSINEKGDTPAPGHRNHLPYTMQLGSGTFDPLFGIDYIGRSDRLSWGGGVHAKIHLGRNDQEYSLGDQVMLTAWIRSKLFFDWLEPSFKLMSHISSTIDGVDSRMATPGAVPVTTPSYFGGEKLIALPGVRITFQKGMVKGNSIEVEGGLPVYQSLNGPLPSEEWRLSIGFNWNF